MVRMMPIGSRGLLLTPTHGRRSSTKTARQQAAKLEIRNSPRGGNGLEPARV